MTGLSEFLLAFALVQVVSAQQATPASPSFNAIEVLEQKEIGACKENPPATVPKEVIPAYCSCYAKRTTAAHQFAGMLKLPAEEVKRLDVDASEKCMIESAQSKQTK